MAQREATATVNLPQRYLSARCDNSRQRHISPCSVSLGSFCRGECKPVSTAKPGGPYAELSLASRRYCAMHDTYTDMELFYREYLFKHYQGFHAKWKNGEWS